MKKKNSKMLLKIHKYLKYKKSVLQFFVQHNSTRAIHSKLELSFYYIDHNLTLILEDFLKQRGINIEVISKNRNMAIYKIGNVICEFSQSMTGRVTIKIFDQFLTQISTFELINKVGNILDDILPRLSIKQLNFVYTQKQIWFNKQMKYKYMDVINYE